MICGNREGFVAYFITGDSMIERIRPGDLVVVDTLREPQSGDTVVAHLNGANSVKIFQRSQARLYLVPNNVEYERQEIKPTDDFTVLGVVSYCLGRF
jgi:DNA polymerase V